MDEKPKKKRTVKPWSERGVHPKKLKNGANFPPAPIGNQRAKGYGRPPQLFTNEEVIEIGEELLKWLEEVKDDEKIVHLSQFYITKYNMAPSEWKVLSDRQCFAAYYEKAIKSMGVKIMTNKRLSESYGNRFLPIYMNEVKEHERSTIEHKIDYEIKKKQEMDSKNKSAPNHELITGLLTEVMSLKGKIQEMKEKENYEHTRPSDSE